MLGLQDSAAELKVMLKLRFKEANRRLQNSASCRPTSSSGKNAQRKYSGTGVVQVYSKRVAALRRRARALANLILLDDAEIGRDLAACIVQAALLGHAIRCVYRLEVAHN